MGIQYFLGKIRTGEIFCFFMNIFTETVDKGWEQTTRPAGVHWLSGGLKTWPERETQEESNRSNEFDA